MERGDHPSMAQARRQLADGEPLVLYNLSPQEALADPWVRKGLGDSKIAGAQLAQDAGFDVWLEAVEWEPSPGERDVDGSWGVSVPEGLERRLQALVWGDDRYPMAHTLTRSTRHPGWQLTTYDRNGEPWSHVEVEGSIEQAFQWREGGQDVGQLAQVIFRDGRVLTREGFEPIATNPREVRALKRRLLR